MLLYLLTSGSWENKNLSSRKKKRSRRTFSFLFSIRKGRKREGGKKGGLLGGQLLLLFYYRQRGKEEGGESKCPAKKKSIKKRTEGGGKERNREGHGATIHYYDSYLRTQPLKREKEKGGRRFTLSLKGKKEIKGRAAVSSATPLSRSEEKRRAVQKKEKEVPAVRLLYRDKKWGGREKRRGTDIDLSLCGSKKRGERKGEEKRTTHVFIERGGRREKRHGLRTSDALPSRSPGL